MSFKSLTLSALLIITACNSGGGGGSSGGSRTNNNETQIPGADDPLAGYAWHLENTGQTTFASAAGTAGEDMNIKEVHDAGVKGTGVKIAVSDSGVDINHSDLSDNGISGAHRDYSDDNSSTWRNGNPYPIEDEAHGTAVTGLIAALGWNGIGSRGVAPSAKYGGFLFIGSFHSSNASYEAKVLDQMTGDFDIFNYSYGYAGCEFVPAEADVITAYESGVTNLRAGKGAIYIQAAGNEFVGSNGSCYDGDTSAFLGNTNTSEDHNHPYMILAGSVNAKGKIASYSSPGSGVWVSAAGGEDGDDNPAMITTDILGCSDGYSSSSSSVTGFNRGSSTLNSKCNYTSVMNGTSSAAPVLSGVVALMLEANPNLTWRDVKHILAMTADKINYSTASINKPGTAGSGLAGHTYDFLYVRNAANVDFSNTYGFGRVNADAAVTMASTYVSALGTYLETPYASSGAINLAIPDNSAAGVTSTINVAQNYKIESVQIKITTNHTYIGDLGVELVSPSGTRSKLLLIGSNLKDSGLTDFTLLTNAFYNENSAGNWQIKVLDGVAQDTGNLTNWKIRISGHL